MSTPADSASLLFPLPPEDRALSPYTGWGRAHLEATADGLVNAALRWAGPGDALLDLPGRPSLSGVRSDGLEGYARTFLAAAFRVTGAGGADPHGWLDRYARGLAAGTRTPGRDDARSWPRIGDFPASGQPMVESASVALGLRLTRPWLWDALDDGVRDRAEEWLRGALRHVPAPNNWYLFPLTVAGFLRSVGRGDRETDLATERGLELLERWYRGGGWYADGEGRSFDHYNGWALHLYPMLHAHLSGDRELLDHLGPRLRAHLDGHGLLFDGNGAPLHFGRSLTYRFATGAAVGLGALTGHTPLSPGTARRLLSGCVRYFLDRGALSPDGLLTLGWHGPHPATLQPYSGPASPYWASKGLLALLVPPGDPLWTAPEEPAPSEGPARAVALPAPGLLVQTGGDGSVRVHNHGSHPLRPQDGEGGWGGWGGGASGPDPLYARFAYSTRTGPTADGNVPDNHFALAVPGSAGGRLGPYSTRHRVHPLGAASGGGWGWAASWHVPTFPAQAPPLPGLRVESVTVVRGAVELRVHRVTGAPGGTAARLTGWATGPEEPLTGLLGLHGWPSDEAAPLRAPQGTAYARWARVPALVSAPFTGTALFVAATALTGTDAGDAVRVEEATDASVTLSWTGSVDGARTRIAFEPLAVEAA
ncbi:DUF2264 domain-containing protein [Streptomyces sp. HNM0574]|uniref:DUF2264 domain-containing protein n=1 Tax=Streptomyces sp. HNM0574 TaxID=2714954 RepID=UPI00146CB057|nr:DUF2264 domain-containing protein [Streptomyces sp. HNM0574]NLU70170.1 DUF2264 domain-containing protein [Streptomyces sp. HNM0574]